MDIVLDLADHYCFDALYSSSIATAGLRLLRNECGNWSSTDVCENALDFSRNAILRQSISLFAVTYAGIFFLYFGFAIASYYVFFDHRIMKHPRFLPGQIRQEIDVSMASFVPVGLMTTPIFLGDVRGYSMLYTGVNGVAGWFYLAFSAVAFLLFTDYLIYWVHRALHHPILYKRIHKSHHRFLIPTPFASHAFHPLDGFVNSLPYHIFVYIVPVHKHLFIALFLLVNIWTIFIHDSEMISNSPFEAYINGPSHHTLHHLYFTVNYGQYFTFADKFNGSFRQPATDEDPMIAVLAALASPSIEKKVDSALYVDGKSTSGRSISSSSTSGSSGNSSEVSDDDSGFEEIEGQVSFSGIIAGGNGQRIKVE